MISEVLATDAYAGCCLGTLFDKFEVVFSDFGVGHAKYIPSEIVFLVSTECGPIF